MPLFGVVLHQWAHGQGLAGASLPAERLSAAEGLRRGREILSVLRGQPAAEKNLAEAEVREADRRQREEALPGVAIVKEKGAGVVAACDAQDEGSWRTVSRRRSTSASRWDLAQRVAADEAARWDRQRMKDDMERWAVTVVQKHIRGHLARSSLGSRAAEASRSPDQAPRVREPLDEDAILDEAVAIAERELEAMEAAGMPIVQAVDGKRARRLARRAERPAAAEAPLAEAEAEKETSIHTVEGPLLGRGAAEGNPGPPAGEGAVDALRELDHLLSRGAAEGESGAPAGIDKSDAERVASVAGKLQELSDTWADGAVKRQALKEGRMLAELVALAAGMVALLPENEESVQDFGPAFLKLAEDLDVKLFSTAVGDDAFEALSDLWC